MPYQATTKDVEKLFEDVINGVQAINLAVDPMTGRNPSYCFVDFKTKEEAERVMQEYDGRDFMRRPLKVKPGVRSGTLTGRHGKKILSLRFLSLVLSSARLPLVSSKSSQPGLFYLESTFYFNVVQNSAKYEGANYLIVRHAL
jgi:RNA recognition motif-containing protein